MRGNNTRVQPDTLLDQIKKEITEYSNKTRMMTWNNDREEPAAASNHSLYNVSYFD